MEHYKAQWVIRWKPGDGMPPIPTAADWKALKRTIEKFGIAATRKHVERYVSEDNAWLRGEGHALRHMPRRIDGYRSTVKTGTGYTPASPDHNETTEDGTDELR
jgi:hypothetical protein